MIFPVIVAITEIYFSCLPIKSYLQQQLERTKSSTKADKYLKKKKNQGNLTLILCLIYLFIFAFDYKR